MLTIIATRLLRLRGMADFELLTSISSSDKYQVTLHPCVPSAAYYDVCERTKSGKYYASAVSVRSGCEGRHSLQEIDATCH